MKVEKKSEKKGLPRKMPFFILFFEGRSQKKGRKKTPIFCFLEKREHQKIKSTSNFSTCRYVLDKIDHIVPFKKKGITKNIS